MGFEVTFDSLEEGHVTHHLVFGVEEYIYPVNLAVLECADSGSIRALDLGFFLAQTWPVWPWGDVESHYIGSKFRWISLMSYLVNGQCERAYLGSDFSALVVEGGHRRGLNS